MSENITFRSSFNGFNRSDVLQFINELMKTNEENRIKIEELTEKLCEKEKKVKELEEKVKKAPDCDNCDLAKQNQVKIGAAILDAKRFSDFMIDEANEKSAKMYESASADAREAAAKARQLSENIKELAGEYSAEFDVLFEKMTKMYESLSDFGNGIIPSDKSVPESVPQVEVNEKEKSDKPSFASGWKEPIGDGVFDPDFNFLDSDENFSISIE